MYTYVRMVSESARIVPSTRKMTTAMVTLSVGMIGDEHRVSNLSELCDMPNGQRTANHLMLIPTH